jgi:hypothetical protein
MNIKKHTNFYFLCLMSYEFESITIHLKMGVPLFAFNVKNLSEEKYKYDKN